MSAMGVSTRSITTTRTGSFALVLCLAFALCIFFPKPIANAWEYCVDPTAEDIAKQEVIDIYERLTHTQSGEPAVELWVKAHFKKPVHNGRYQMELWHEETGSRIKYKGPYDVCCGLKVNSSCGHGVFLKDPIDSEKPKQEEATDGTTTTPTDCPIEGEFIGHFVKSLHQEEGAYELTFQFFGGEGATEEELLCIVVPFGVQREKEQPPPPRRPATSEETQSVNQDNEEVLLLAG